MSTDFAKFGARLIHLPSMPLHAAGICWPPLESRRRRLLRRRGHRPLLLSASAALSLGISGRAGPREQGGLRRSAFLQLLRRPAWPLTSCSGRSSRTMADSPGMIPGSARVSTATLLTPFWRILGARQHDGCSDKRTCLDANA